MKKNKHRPDPKTYNCPCGAPAIAWQTGGWVCAPCAEKERIHWQRVNAEEERRRLRDNGTPLAAPEPFRVHLPTAAAFA